MSDATHHNSTGHPKVLVTGAGGQVGNEFRELAAQFPQFEFLFASRDELSIDDAKNMRQYFSKHSPAYCINCAAYTAVDKAEQPQEGPKALRVNAEAVKELALLCKEYQTKFIQISTDYVFNGEGTQPYPVTHKTDPISVYGHTKLLGEQYALEADPECIIIRSAWIYSSFGKNFVKTMLRLFREKKEIQVVNDQHGSPTYAADLARAIMEIIVAGKWVPGIYHFTNGGACTWYEFAVAIRDYVGSACVVHPIPSSDYPVPAKRPAYSVLDTSRIQDIYGIVPKDWKLSLTTCLDILLA